MMFTWLLPELFFLLGQLLQLLGIRIDLVLQLLCLFLFALAHQCADLFGNLLSVRTQLVCLLLCLSLLCIQLDDFIHQTQLLILEFIFNVLFYNIGIFS